MPKKTIKERTNVPSSKRPLERVLGGKPKWENKRVWQGKKVGNFLRYIHKRIPFDSRRLNFQIKYTDCDPIEYAWVWWGGNKKPSRVKIDKFTFIRDGLSA